MDIRLIYGKEVRGLGLGPHSECDHYHSAVDVIAIRFKCCEAYYSCYSCHEALAGHAAQRWPAYEFDCKAVLCGACGHELTIAEYMEGSSQCPACEAPFNPGCRDHWSLYFEV